LNTNRTRAILAAQKVKQQATPQPLPADFTLPQLTAEQRKAIYAPRAASSVPRHIQGPQWVEAWRMMTRITYGLTAIFSLFFGGVMAGESKKGFKG
jgi:hypothetical protein